MILVRVVLRVPALAIARSTALITALATVLIAGCLALSCIAAIWCSLPVLIASRLRCGLLLCRGALALHCTVAALLGIYLRSTGSRSPARRGLV